MLAKEMAYPTHSLAKSLAKICLFPHDIAIAKDFAMASVNGTIDNIQFPFFGIANTISLRAQCEWNLNIFN